MTVEIIVDERHREREDEEKAKVQKEKQYTEEKKPK